MENNENIVIKADQVIRDYLKNGRDETSEKIHVLKGVDLEISQGEFVGIMGKSGCGKTTLLKLLGLIDKQTEGTMYFKGKDTNTLLEDELSDIRRREIGFVFQDFYLMDTLSVQENIMLPMVIDKKDESLCYQKSQDYTKLFGIEALLPKNVFELSGGEKQRVAICRALMNDPGLILADEPTGNLDSKAGKVVIQTMEKINQDMGKTIVMVTHDPQMASYCNRVLLMKDGIVMEELKRTSKEQQEDFYEEILGKMNSL